MTTLDRVQQILSFIPKDSKDNIHLRKKLEELEQEIINKIEDKFTKTERTENFLSYLVVVIVILSMVAILSITCQSAIEVWGR